MNNTHHLRTFLSRQHGTCYCVKCLTSHGYFGIVEEAVFQMVISSVQDYSTALTAAFDACSVCKAITVCVTFPGRIVSASENRWALVLLTSGQMAQAA